MVFILSDTHFNHSNIIKYCNRPFKSVDEMNDVIINNWNKVVGKDDIVFHLGDFFLGSKYDLKDIVSRLNGKIYLVRGNHDRLSIKSYEDFGIVVLKGVVILDEFRVVLSHKPLVDSIIKDDYINIHGHIHDKRLEDIYDNDLYDCHRHINVSLDVLDFKPVLLENLLKEDTDGLYNR